jgi:xanthine dehydrogenase accessory factor
MHPQFPLWQFIVESVQHGKAVMLMYVLESNGSSPGRQGFGMAVNASSEMKGSIGGGIMEHKFVEMAKALLAKGQKEYRQVVQQFHDKEAATDQSGMICSGDQTIFLYLLQKADLSDLKRLRTSLEQNKNGTLELSEQGLRFFDDTPTTDFLFEKKLDGSFIYREKTGYKNKLFVAGGGHCSLALCRMMSDMDFYIHVFEERNALNTLEQNNYAHEKTIVESYRQLEELIPGGTNHYIVLMTFGYRTDDIAIRALLQKDFRYFGILGSGKKIGKMFSGYIAEGISEERLKRIYAPIGLAIHSQTPGEIAVSIAAQIIQVKNGVMNDE